MKLTEFYNRQKNVLKASIAKRIELEIPITEEREKFYTGGLFAKHDTVICEGEKYTVVEQGCNYFKIADSNGEVLRKFPRQLKLSESKAAVLSEDSFHGYKFRSEESKEFVLNLAEEIVSGHADDIAILKEAKQLDTHVVSKEKLTVAKIIADAVGVQYDSISTPENLINQAIAKAKKDPKIVKNKDLFANMLLIAKETGIKFNDTTFTKE